MRPLHQNMLLPYFLALLALSVQAEDAPAGQRVFYSGHSFHMFIVPRVEQLATAAGIQGNKTVGQQMIGGSRVIQHWVLADDKNKAKSALTGGQVDVFTMAPNIQMPDAGIDNFVELGLKNNPNMRFLVQDSWVPYDKQPDHVKDNAERDGIELDVLQSANDNAWSGGVVERKMPFRGNTLNWLWQ